MTNTESPAILIVEDELIVASDLQQSLSEIGYDAFAIAASGEEAVARAEERWPDVVLMDIRIKGPQDGIQTAAMLKNKDSVIVVFLTAHADDPMIDRAKCAAPDGYLIKPVKLADLRGTIEMALHRRQLDTEKEKTRAHEHRLFTIANNVPIAIAYFDRKGKVQFANSVFRSLVAYQDDPIGASAMSFLGEPLYRASYQSRQSAMFGDAGTIRMELEQNGIPRHYEVTYLPDRDNSGTVTGVYALGYDITEREQLMSDLRRAHADLATILNAMPARIISWNKDLTSRFANAAAQAQFRVLRDRSVGQDMRIVLGEARYSNAARHIECALAGQTTVREQIEYDDNGPRYSDLHLIPDLKDGKVVGLHSVAFDVTDLSTARERIRQLARRLETVREEERRAIAVILHDGIAQDLFALKLDIDYMEATTKRQVGATELWSEISAAVSRCMDDTRIIANELRPVALERFGVSAMITEHARRFAKHAHLRIEVAASEALPQLDEASRLLLFRAAQEALTNVARHAHATTVNIALYENKKQVTMEITDDGIGLVAASLNKPHSLGLLGLRERVESVGGVLTVTRNTPKGAKVVVQLPATEIGEPCG